MKKCLKRAVASLAVLGLFAGQASAATFHLASTPDTVHRGVISPSIAPVLHIKSGDTVTIDTISHSGLSPDPVAYFARAGIPASAVLKDAVAVAKMPPKDYGVGRGGGHVLTGPIYIDDAEPGDMLEIRIKAVTPRVPYGANGAGLGGAAPNMPGIPKPPPGARGEGGKIIKYDPATKTVNFADDIHYPMRPFMGIMAVAPTKAISSKAPGQYGGNMDFEKLQAGSTLYLPVLVKGALFVTGDSHASQGDGEVSGNALEASMAPTLEFIVHKGEGKDMALPLVEDKANFYVLGMDHDLGKSLTNAIQNTVKFLGTHYGMSPQDAYSLCSTAVDFGIAEAVDLNLVTYGKVSKSWFKKKTPYWKPGA